MAIAPGPLHLFRPFRVLTTTRIPTCDCRGCIPYPRTPLRLIDVALMDSASTSCHQGRPTPPIPIDPLYPDVHYFRPSTFKRANGEARTTLAACAGRLRMALMKVSLNLYLMEKSISGRYTVTPGLVLALFTV